MILLLVRLDCQMADPDSEAPQREHLPILPPVSSPEHGLSACAPSPDKELRAGGQGVQDGPEEEEEEGGGGASTKPRPSLLHVHRHVIGRGHRRIGGQNLRAIDHMSPPPAAPSPITVTSVSGSRTVLLSNEARREMAKQARAAKEERRATLDARHRYLISRLVDGGTPGEPEVEDSLISDDKFSLVDDFFAANGSKKLIFFYQDVKQVNRCFFLFPRYLPFPRHRLSHRALTCVSAQNRSSGPSSSVDQRKLFLTTGSSEVQLFFNSHRKEPNQEPYVLFCAFLFDFLKTNV
ncbi:uncharacterized protein LOC116380116 isoform X1 [Anarrhichthys ocellatus]|uniref:uncharacterized protein LOC116380116 isoform X1 n=1 Tax=Anarrhichthys ocellatus TaxID=433405 RepID=UPI0012EE0C09|nr:uncharacterized protein LOC116380116 isoform X1 [Anarrhichthys ocellatus]